MDKEMFELLVKKIKDGSVFKENCCDINAFMEEVGMGIYADLCIRRVLESPDISSEHIRTTLAYNNHILLDLEGMEMAKEILISYIPLKKYQQAIEDVRSLNKKMGALNEILFTLRTLEKKELSRQIEVARKSGDPEVKWLIKAMQTELISRSVLGSVGRKFVYLLRKIAERREQHRIVHRVANDSKAFEDIYSRIINRKYKADRKTTYRNAWDRLIDRYEGVIDPQKLRKDELMKYIHLGVKGVVRYNYVEQDDECRRLYAQSRYQNMKNIFTAIGRLTPTELQQLFPVKKIYDGEKYQTKDYYYTMEKIARYGRNNPIGDYKTAVRFLEDYMNDDLMMLSVSWCGAIGDLAIYYDKKAPLNEYLEREEAENL